MRHPLRNAALPVVTLRALEVPALSSGAMVAESIFGWPGMGRVFLDSALRFDHPVLLGLVTIVATLVIVTALACDLVYAWLDPAFDWHERLHGRAGRPQRVAGTCTERPAVDRAQPRTAHVAAFFERGFAALG